VNENAKLLKPLSSVHFEGGFNFLDLFLPGRGFASDDRGRCFLWMIFHYLERPEDDNPFHDKYSRSHSPKAPLLRPLTGEELARENVDTLEEIEWGHKMSSQRNAFLQRLVASLEREKREKSHPSFDGTSSVSVMKSKRPMAELENLSGQPSARSAGPEQSPSEKGFINYMPDPQKRENRRGMLSSLFPSLPCS
jgi:Ino eighty subunit 1